MDIWNDSDVCSVVALIGDYSSLSHSRCRYHVEASIYVYSCIVCIAIKHGTPIGDCYLDEPSLRMTHCLEESSKLVDTTHNLEALV